MNVVHKHSIFTLITYEILELFFVLDVNECVDDDLHSCEQVCDNTHGSHSCLCFDGYELSIDGFSCNGEKYYSCLFSTSYDIIRIAIHSTIIIIIMLPRY